jgi:Ca-activated chloride channel family protein
MKQVSSFEFRVSSSQTGPSCGGNSQLATRNSQLGVKSPLLAILLLAAAAALPADSARSVVSEGNALYSKGKHEAALQKYTRAQALLPNSPLLSYNMGNVYFRQKDYDKAVEAYGRAAQAPDKALAGAAYFNAGNAQFAKEDYLQAIEMYKQALQLDPEDRDAKANIELARRKLKEQTKPQQQEQQQQQQDQRQDQQQQQQAQQEQDQGEEQKPRPKPGEEKKDDDSRPAGPDRKDELSPEEAERILQALQKKDKDEQKKQKEKMPVSGTRGGQDW